MTRSDRRTRTLEAAAGAALATALLFGPSVADAKFRTLQRTQASTHLDAAYSFVLPDASELEVGRTDLYGEFAFGGFGAFAALPVTNGIGSSTGSGSVGNLELGLLGQYEFGPVALVGSFAVAVPTADDSFEDVLLNGIGGFTRVEDLLTSTLPDSTALRFGVSPRLTTGPVFFQADLGFDVFVDGPLQDETGYHVAAGLGANILIATATVEIAHMELIDSAAGSLDTQTIATSLSLNYPLISPFLSYSTLLENAGDVHIVSMGATLGF